MAGLGDSDGYEGTAVLEVAGRGSTSRCDCGATSSPSTAAITGMGVLARMKAGRLLGSGKASGVLTTAEGSAPARLSEPDPSRRYRVTGISTPPFRQPLRTEPPGRMPAPSGAGAADAAGQTEPRTGRGPAAPLPGHVRVAVIGAGFGGIGAGIRLRQAGVTDFVILERATAVGGTWRDNTYPGCACDVPSHLYSFSFAPNPGWSHSFSRQPEIWRVPGGRHRPVRAARPPGLRHRGDPGGLGRGPGALAAADQPRRGHRRRADLRLGAAVRALPARRPGAGRLLR